MIRYGEKNLFWIGNYKKVGIVIYDKLTQQGLSEVWVRLFKVAESRFGLFTKSEARIALAASIGNESNMYEPEATAWLKMQKQFLKLKGRKANCLRCGVKLNSYDNAWCPKCYWIKCKCGACGCEWQN